MHSQKNIKINSMLLGLIAGSYFIPAALFAQPAGCPSGVLTTGNQVITCSTASSSGSPQSATEIGTYSRSTLPPAGSSSLTTTAYDGINLTINQYTTISTSASPIGLASGSTVTNSGVLNSTLNYGYGISFGVNGRSQNGGNTATNTAVGQITTSGPNSDGMTVSATKASSQGNTLTNNGSIITTGSSAYGMSIVSGSSGVGVSNSISNNGTVSTQGANSYGIQLNSSSGVNNVTNSGSGTITTSGAGADGINVTNTRNAVTINNSATIAVTGTSASAIRVDGAANITNSGTLNSASSTAIVFGGTLPSGSYNTLTLADTSSINSGIAFNKASTNETLTFTGYSSNPVFSNAISGLNIINAVNGSTVTMNNSAGYELVSGVINVENTSSSLAITSIIKDQSSPSVAASSITKIGTGNLTLSGSNAYTGITDIQAGSIITGAANTLPSTTAVTVASGAALTMNNYSQSIGSLAGSGAVALGSGSLTTGNDNTSTVFSGGLSGTGGLIKVGSGIFELSGVNTYSGDTNVSGGTLRLLSDVTSNVLIASSANLQGGPVITGSVTNSGNIQPSFNESTANLTISGNYVGNNGTFTSNIWGPSTSPVADRLIISGAGNAASGTTGIIAVDRGGLGKPISGNEIPLVTVASGATTEVGALVLSGRVASGAYEYSLYRGGAIPGTNPNNWYLRTDNPEPPVIPITPDASERIEVAVYPALPSLVQMYAQTAVDALDQRRGD
jgi:autotransporter-associated beta strand protein